MPHVELADVDLADVDLKSGPVAEHVVWKVPPALAGLVSSGVGYRLEGFPAGVHAGLPSRCLSLVISFREPIEMVARREGGPWVERLTASASGLHDRPVEIHHDGTQFGLHLELTPSGSRSLFGMAAAELASATLPLDLVLGPCAGELVERLALSSDWATRFSIVGRSLLSMLREVPPPPAELAHAWSRLSATDGSTTVTSLAAEVGWSRRYLSERFKQEIGLSPKVVGRIMRFEGAVAMLRRSSRPGLADVAASCGYADQAHLTREWIGFTGASPTAWAAAERFPFVQDVDLVDVAS